MLDANLARIRTHRNNIHRYRRLLRTELSDLEREFIEKRMADEQTALDAWLPKPSRRHFPFRSIRPFPRAWKPCHERRSRSASWAGEKVIWHYRLLASAKTEEDANFTEVGTSITSGSRTRSVAICWIGAWRE